MPRLDAPITAVARAFDDGMAREVFPERRYVLLLDMSPDGWRDTVRRLNDHLRLMEKLDHQIRAQDYRLELHSEATGAHVLTWHFTEES